MNLDTQTKSQLFINNVDQDTRDKIIKLDQKLKGLYAEVEAKIQSLPLSEEGNAEKIDSFSVIAQDIENAINGINTLVNLISDSENPKQSPIFDEEEMAEFKEKLTINLEKISQIQKQI